MRFPLVLRFALRDWRAGELRLLVYSVALAVGTVTGISLFVDRLSGALLSESATYLAADRVIASTHPLPDELSRRAARLGLATTRTLTFPSMLFAGERNQLVSVKAVDDGYPLRGTLRVAKAPFGDGAPVRELPQKGEVWLDSRLFPALAVAVGDFVTIGVAQLRVARVLSDEPDRGASFFDLGPRALMRTIDVPRTEVIRPGSRISYRLLIAGSADVIEQLHGEIAAQLGGDARWLGIRDSSASIGSALERADAFLLLGGVMAVLLAGVAVALAAQRYARRHYDHVAILKTLGATPAEIQWGYVALLGVAGGAATAVGLLFGVALHLMIIAVLSAYVPLDLPLPGIKPPLIGVVSGIVCLVAFALPPVLALKSISPMRVMRRDFARADAARWLTYGSAALGTVALLLWYTNSVRLTLVSLGAIGGVSVVFGALAFVLLRVGRRVGMQAGNVWRLALAALARRRGESVAQILVFGLALMLLLIMIVLRTALLDVWRTQVPEGAPNHFLMNVAPDQVEPLQRMASGRVRMGELYPMSRGRVVAVNGVATSDWEKSHHREAADPGLDSERNLSWTATLPSNNRIEAGEWWSADETEPKISVEEGYARAAGVGIGDVLDFDIGGLPLHARVASIRRVEWTSMAPNFFILFSPGALRDVPATSMTSFYLTPQQKPFLNELLAAFPTVTVIEVDRVIAQIQSVIGRVTQAIQLVLVLVLVAGCLVLLASIQASGDERLREHALLRALGASRRLVRGAMAVEFALLGAFAGGIAAFGTEVTVYALDRQVFDLPRHLHPWVWFAGPALGAALVSCIGSIGARSLTESPPVLVLRELG